MGSRTQQRDQLKSLCTGLTAPFRPERVDLLVAYRYKHSKVRRRKHGFHLFERHYRQAVELSGGHKRAITSEARDRQIVIPEHDALNHIRDFSGAEYDDLFHEISFVTIEPSD